MLTKNGYRYSLRYYPIKLVVLLQGLSLILMAGCSTVKFQEFEAKPFDHNPYSQIKHGLAIAIHPISSKEESNKYFGTDLLAANVLALHVTLENRSPVAEFLLLKERISLSQAEQTTKQTTDTNDIGSPEVGKNVVRVSMLSVLAPALIPVIFVGAQMVTDSFEVKRNFIVKELRSTTLSPNETLKGFVYFALPKENGPPSNLHFSIDITNQRTKSSESFVIPFIWERESNP